jgi:hypothetical protein
VSRFQPSKSRRSCSTRSGVRYNTRLCEKSKRWGQIPMRLHFFHAFSYRNGECSHPSQWLEPVSGWPKTFSHSLIRCWAAAQGDFTVKIDTLYSVYHALREYQRLTLEPCSHCVKCFFRATRPDRCGRHRPAPASAAVRHRSALPGYRRSYSASGTLLPPPQRSH